MENEETGLPCVTVVGISQANTGLPMICVMPIVKWGDSYDGAPDYFLMALEDFASCPEFPA